MKKLILVSLIALISTSSFCAETQKEKEAPKKHYVSLGLTGSTDMKKIDDERKKALMSGSITFAMLPHRYWTIALSLGASKELTDYREENLGNGSLSVTRNPVQLLKGVLFSNTASILLPFNDDQRRITTTRTQVSYKPGFIYTFGAHFKNALKHLTISYSPSVSKGIHQYQTDAFGTKNTSVSASNTLSLSYTPKDWLIFSAYISNMHRWNYESERKDDVYSAGQSITFVPMKKLGVTLGHERGGRTFDYDGQTYDVDLFDSDDSTIYISLSYTL